MADTSWGKVSEWYGEYLDNDNDSYHVQVIRPNLLRLLNIKQDELVLDVACGEGFFSRAMSEVGARVTALDASPELIKMAKKKSDPRIDFRVLSADNMATIADGRFKKAICVLAIQNIAHLDKLVSEVSRVLEPGGQWIIVMNHPAFRIPKSSSWGFDEDKNTQYRRVDGYMSEQQIDMLMNPGGGKPIYTVSFHRPLQSYFKQLDKAGFAVKRAEEWISHKKSSKGPRAQAEDNARHEIPLFMTLVAVKLA